MSGFRLTDAQREAVELRGKPILVSAAAGSGKTRVLTERLMARVSEGEDISRFLVITFTKAAAAELRGRILAELSERLAKDPGNPWLRRQSSRIYRAQIGTIDSFCAAVVREHAASLGIAPGFTVLDEERSRAMRARALEDVLDKAYERIGEDDGLRLLVDSVGAGRDDKRLGEIVLSLYDQMRSRAWPERWAREKLAALEPDGVTDAGETVWGRYLLADARDEAAYCAEALEAAVSRMAAPEYEADFAGYIESFQAAALYFRDIARACGEGWDKAHSIAAAELPKLGRVKKGGDETLKERVKAVWDHGRDAAKSVRTTLAGESEALLRGVRQSKPALAALMELVFALQREYDARKRRADACDFSDVEHFCVQLLCDPETGEATGLAAALSARFAEVMVDEYQDVNGVQELIFRRVSGEGQRLFMVGDVKQSIYRFRLAEPEIFNRKFREFAADENAGRVLLRENFRSRGAVLDACNAVFGRIMSPELGDILYNDEARLVRGAEYPEAGETLPELCLLDANAADDGEETPDKRLAEARYVAARIQKMVEDGEPVSDGAGGTRPVAYGDIAVLLRTPKTSGAAFRRALTEAGIPVSARQGGAFFSRPEIVFAVSMLAVADNPRQDVPLIAAMRGLPFSFTPDELTAVRAAKKGDLWDALALRAETDAKCARLVSTVSWLRDLAREEPTESVLRQLYDRTGLLAACAVMPDAALRYASLMELYEYARRFEEDGGRGLFRFLSWLRSLEENGMEPSGAVSANSVQIMSVHKSKGLEFPVVFLVDNGHKWQLGGAEQVLCHGEMGLGMRVTDAARGVNWPTLPWRAISRRIRREELSEQERVLYVAMTRARERLIMTCTVPKAAEKLAALPAGEDGPIRPQLLTGAGSAAPWLMRAAAADGGRTIRISVVAPGQARPEAAKPERAYLAADPADVAALSERLAWRYPFEAAVALPSKLTATGVKRLLEEADPEARALSDGQPRQRRFRTPELGRFEAPLTGAERGVAAHLVMQHIDFAKTGSTAQIADEIARLRQRGFLDERQADAVKPGDILAFFRSDIGRRVLAADRAAREFRFSLLCPAQTWFPDSPDGEEILLQGVVDLCIEEDGALTVIDFKTDASIEPERHVLQLAAYAEAMRRIFRKPVRGAVLWYLRKKTAVEVEIPEQAERFT